MCILLQFQKVIEEMPDEEFERHKMALEVKKLEKPKTVFSQFAQFHSEISLAQYHFDRSEIEVNILRKLTKDDVLECYKVSYRNIFQWLGRVNIQLTTETSLI